MMLPIHPLETGSPHPDLHRVTLIAFAFIRLLPGDPVLLMAGERGVSARALCRAHAAARLRPADLAAVPRLSGRHLPRRFRHLARHQEAGAGRVPDPVPGDGRAFALRHHLATLIGIPAGVWPRSSAAAGSTRSRWAPALVGYSMPIFWWGLLLIILFSGMAGLDAGLGPHR
jgi:dipeptide transport system permease protein